MNSDKQTLTISRSRNYLIYLIIFMGLVAIMDQYLSSVKMTALPYICQTYNISTADFEWWEGWYLIPTFFIFLLNGLNDIIGRKLSILILILMMGFSSIAIVLYTSTFHLFMFFYAIMTFTTVSNMWSIPISEESPAQKRAKQVALVYVIGLIPLQAIFPPFLINTLGLDWKWMYGVMFIFMIPVLIIWLFMKETLRYNVIKEERGKGIEKIHYFGLGSINRKDIRYIILSAIIWGSWLVTSFLFYMAGSFFMDIHGYSLTEWSIVLLIALIATMIGGVTGGWVMEKIGRGVVLTFGCIGLALSLSVLGFVPRNFLPFAAPFAGFFISFVYSWIVVYIPEIFPTERRGSCMGWTTTFARFSYIIGPFTASWLLRIFPMMDWFWVAAGFIMLTPILVVLIFKPHETKSEELEIIEAER